MKSFKLTRRKLILISILVICIFIPSVFAYDYFQNNPKSCTSCHLMNPAYETWDTSAMHDVKCHSCHETSIVVSIGHIIDVLTKKPQEVTLPTEVDNELCQNCHASNDPKWLQVQNTSGHIVHFFQIDQPFNGEVPPDCIDCHGLQLHVFEPPEETCDECHEETIMMGSEEMHIHCLVCHEFISHESFFPERKDCVTCHEGKETMEITFPSEAHQNTTCSACHDPHSQEQHIDCITCHDVEGFGFHQQTAHSNCISCHVPHSSETMRNVCLNCHTDKSEHYQPYECTSCHSFIS